MFVIYEDCNKTYCQQSIKKMPNHFVSDLRHVSLEIYDHARTGERVYCNILGYYKRNRHYQFCIETKLLMI